MNYNSEDTDQKIKYHTYFSMDQQGQNLKNFDIEKKIQTRHITTTWT